MSRNNEQGSARVKLIVFLVIFALVSYVGYMYLPVAVDSYYYKDFMQNKVDQAAALGYDSGWLKDQMVKIGPEYHVPPDALITAGPNDQRVELHVKFTRPISFPGYTYNYEFDQRSRVRHF